MLWVQVSFGADSGWLGSYNLICFSTPYYVIGWPNADVAWWGQRRWWELGKKNRTKGRGHRSL